VDPPALGRPAAVHLRDDRHRKQLSRPARPGLPLDQFKAEYGPDADPTEEQLRELRAFVRDSACQPIAAQPAFRDLLETKRRDREITIDHLASDEVLETGYDEEKARQLVTSWKQFLEDNQDEITALQILYNKPHARRHLVYEELKTLAEAIARPPYHIAPAEVWKAYEMLEGLKRNPNQPHPARVLTNLITLVRHTVDPDGTPLAPFPELVETRFEKWLEQQQRGVGLQPASSTQSAELQTPRFTEAQLVWLKVIRGYIALNGAFATDNQTDYLEAWQSVDSRQGTPIAMASKAFGSTLKAVISELNQVLIA